MTLFSFLISQILSGILKLIRKWILTNEGYCCRAFLGYVWGKCLVIRLPYQLVRFVKVSVYQCCVFSLLCCCKWLKTKTSCCSFKCCYKTGTWSAAGLQGATILVTHAPKNLSSAIKHFHQSHQCTWDLEVYFFQTRKVIAISCWIWFKWRKTSFYRFFFLYTIIYTMVLKHWVKMSDWMHLD